MSTTADRLTQLQHELDTLKQIQTQEEFDEGARLHAEKNAPWISGMYSHLKFPPYKYEAYPRLMYHIGYAEAKRELEAAQAMHVGNDPQLNSLRNRAIEDATKHIDLVTKRVETEADERRLDDRWARTPTEADARRLAIENDLAVQAAHLNYEDRNLTGAALAERERADELADGHLVDVTGTLAKAKARKPRATVTV